MSTNDGGPAFPHDGQQNYTGGLTLRDYFAAKAMQSILLAAMRVAGSESRVDFAAVAAAAYRMAAEMLRKGGSMTDAQAALAQVREALEAGPTPREWLIAGEDKSFVYSLGPHGTNAFWAHVQAAGPERISEAEKGANAKLIAACSPANMTAIIAHVDAQAAEIERLTAEVASYQQTLREEYGKREALDAEIERLTDAADPTYPDAERCAQTLEACEDDLLTEAQFVRWQGQEIERLTAALKWEQHRAERLGTHGPGCADWGPEHYECAIRERDELRRQLAEAEQDARRFDWLAERLEDVQIDDANPLEHYHGDEEDVPYPVLWRRAIDAAMGASNE